MEVKYKLIAEIIKQWRSSSEERALAEAILYMTGLHLTDMQKLSTQELTNVLIEVIRRPEEKGIQGEVNATLVKLEAKEKESTTPYKGEEVLEKIPEENDDLTSSDIEDYSYIESSTVPERSLQPEDQLEIPSKLSFLEEKKAKRGRPKNE